MCKNHDKNKTAQKSYRINEKASFFCNSSLIGNCTMTSAIVGFVLKSQSSSFNAESIDAKRIAQLLPARNEPVPNSSLAVGML